MSRAEDRDRLDVVERLDRGRAPLVVEHRQLAEDVAGAEVRQRDRAAVGVLADRAGVAGAHDVARVRLVALAEDHALTGLEPARDGHLDHALRSSGASVSKTGTCPSSPALSSAAATPRD